MKRAWYLSALFVLVAVAGVGSHAFAGTKLVVLTNNTTYTMTAFYASPSDYTSWNTNSNLLSGQSIAPGQTTTVVINDGLDDCVYDLMGVLYGAAQYAYTYQINTCTGGTWNITIQ